MLSLSHRMPVVGFCAAAVLWLAGLALGWAYLLQHAYSPEQPALASSDLKLPENPQNQAVLFIHPLCPCSRATMQELSESLVKVPEHARVKVVFVTAGLSDEQVRGSSLLKAAKTLRNVDVAFDETGALAEQYGAKVSGEMLAFDDAGKLVFRGGITPARGHQGDALGQKFFEESLRGSRTSFCSSPVYGCKLSRP